MNTHWKYLDLTKSHSRPAPGQLVALRMVPTGSRATLYYNSVRNDIGEFKSDPNTGRKLWWHGTCGCNDPVRMKKHYAIWWCPVQEFDGI